MRFDPTYYLLGYRVIGADSGESAELLDLCMKNGYVYDCFHGDERGRVSIRCRERTALKLIADCEKNGIFIYKLKRGGLPLILSKFGKRYGVIAGLLFACFLVFLSGRYIWDVRVSGNSYLTVSEVRTAVSECGIGVGSHIPDVFTDVTETAVLLADDRISWISINLDGTVAEVQIRERESTENHENKAANIVAARSGYIEYIQMENGNLCVKTGDHVDRGDLLIGGIYDSSVMGIRFARASGRVFARTVEEIRVEIPYEYMQKTYTGKVFTEKYVNFFNYNINISKKYGNIYNDCDIIYKAKSVNVSDGTELPFGTREKIYCEYEESPAKRCREDAEKLAYYRLNRRIDEIIGDGQLLKKDIKLTDGENILILECVITYIGDIAEVREFDVLSDDSR